MLVLLLACNKPHVAPAQVAPPAPTATYGERVAACQERSLEACAGLAAHHSERLSEGTWHRGIAGSFGRRACMLGSLDACVAYDVGEACRMDASRCEPGFARFRRGDCLDDARCGSPAATLQATWTSTDALPVAGGGWLAVWQGAYLLPGGHRLVEAGPGWRAVGFGDTVLLLNDDLTLPTFQEKQAVRIDAQGAGILELAGPTEVRCGPRWSATPTHLAIRMGGQNDCHTVRLVDIHTGARTDVVADHALAYGKHRLVVQGRRATLDGPGGTVSIGLPASLETGNPAVALAADGAVAIGTTEGLLVRVGAEERLLPYRPFQVAWDPSGALWVVLDGRTLLVGRGGDVLGAWWTDVAVNPDTIGPVAVHPEGGSLQVGGTVFHAAALPEAEAPSWLTAQTVRVGLPNAPEGEDVVVRVGGLPAPEVWVEGRFTDARGRARVPTAFKVAIDNALVATTREGDTLTVPAAALVEGPEPGAVCAVSFPGMTVTGVRALVGRAVLRPPPDVGTVLTVSGAEGHYEGVWDGGAVSWELVPRVTHTLLLPDGTGWPGVGVDLDGRPGTDVVTELDGTFRARADAVPKVSGVRLSHEGTSHRLVP